MTFERVGGAGVMGPGTFDRRSDGIAIFLNDAAVGDSSVVIGLEMVQRSAGVVEFALQAGE